jgi:hypothetical protein
MSRTAVTITDHNGAKVRTVASKRYFVVNSVVTNYVGYDPATGKSVFSDEYKATARVDRRTDSAAAAQAELKKSSFNTVYLLTTNDKHRFVTRALTDTEVHNRARFEKQNKSFAKRSANNGAARSFSY